MERNKLIPLKITTEYSLLKSLIKVDNLISFLMQNNINTCAICDDNLMGFMEFYLKCKENNIKPIVGLDIVFSSLHIYLYAKNYLGYQHLLKINYLINENKLDLDKIENENILIILPYSSIELYDSIKNKNNLYIGYSKIFEKQNALLISENIVYLNNIRCLYEKDTQYLKYLKMLNNSFVYDENSYYKDASSEDIKSTIEFCNNINLDIPFNKKYIPIYCNNSFEKLKQLTFLGLEKRFNNKVSNEYIKRLNYELDVINKMGFVDYFLIVYDYVLFAKKNGIMVGPGRGSAAGSLVSFSLGITNIDPIKYNLLFERFLNPYRKKMPDIDIDFESDKRIDIIKYVKNKYGFDKVAVGLTFNTYKSKLILRDIAKILNIDEDLFNKFIKCIDSQKNLTDNLKNEKVKKYLDLYNDLKNIYDISIHLEGLKKNTSTHAAGVVISSEKLGSIIPVTNENGLLKTGIEMPYLEKLGLLKMDFLALEKLSIISGIVKKIGNLDIDKIPLDDEKTINVFKNADTDDIFQFESTYAKNVLSKIKVSNFNELIIAIALVRPGANKQIDEYLKNKNSNYEIDNFLKDILKETYGTILYQEQVMKIFEKIAGYSLFKADEIRVAMSKKKEDIINNEYNNFVSGAVKNGYEKVFAQNLFNKIKEFGQYGFNKSHSVAYAVLSYQMAYLKANYFKEFSLYLLEESPSKEKCESILCSLKKNGYKLLKPNINLSNNNYQVKNNYILLPFSIIKGVNNQIINDIISKRGNGFKDIFDFMIKCNDFMTKDIFNILVKSSCLDVFNINKHTLINNYDLIYNYASLNDLSLAKPIIQDENEYDENILREFELNTYGFYINNHPCSIFKNVIKVDVIKDYLFKNINMVLIVNKIKEIKDKNGKDMAFIDAEDDTGKIELTIFNNLFDEIINLKENDIILLNGKVSKRFDKYKIIVNNIKRK
ncbi:MAG: DNA polymerase III subunit alpha [bacterium]|nr:DNA polymerase III subunit alpha [bacterium]